MNIKICSALLLPFFLVSSALAQHDAERNAVQAIAVGDLDKAEKLLKKSLPGYESEVEFVRMMIDLKAGDTDAAVAHAKLALDRGLPFDRLIA